MPRSISPLVSWPKIKIFFKIEGNKKYCGNHNVFPQDAPTPNREYKSTGNVMRITFVSDYSNEEPFPLGFAAHWTEEGEAKY